MNFTVSYLQSENHYRFLPPISLSLPFPSSNQIISTVSFLQSLQSDYLCHFLTPIRWTPTVTSSKTNDLYRFLPPIRWSLSFPPFNQMISIPFPSSNQMIFTIRWSLYFSILQSDPLYDFHPPIRYLQLLSLTDPYPCRLPSADILLFPFSNLMIFGPVVFKAADIFKLLPINLSPCLFSSFTSFNLFLCPACTSSICVSSSKQFLEHFSFFKIATFTRTFFVLFISPLPLSSSIKLFLYSVNFLLLSSFNFCKSDLPLYLIPPIDSLPESLYFSECNHSYDRRCYKSLTTVYEPTQVNLMHL